MEEAPAANELLKRNYDLNKAPEVEAAAKRHTGLTGEPVPEDPLSRIQNYLNRFKEITDRENPERRARGMYAIKQVLYRKHVIKPDEIPESYWENQKRIIRERGQGGDLEQGNWEETKRQNTEAIIADQQSSLASWIDYLSSPDAPYPDSIKYFALRSILELGKYDKAKKEFPKRYPGMTQPFPELDREALAYVADGLVKKYGPEYFALHESIDTAQSQLAELDIYQQKRTILDALPTDAAGKTITVEIEGKTRHLKRKDVERMRRTLQPPATTDREALQEKIKVAGKERTDLLRRHNLPDEFQDLPEEEDFAKLYSYAIEKVTPVSTKELANTQGQWVKYDKGSDHMPLVASLQGHGTGWCTAGESTAQTQLQGGDFYVYYSHDGDGKPTVPRVAIRMEGTSIAEVRGIAPQQNLDPYVGPIVEQKLEEFPDGKAYQKKVADMKRLTEIDHKTQAGEALDASELMFLYEIDSPIQGFGYSRDPRINELRAQRNPKGDMPIVFGCEPAQIAYTPGDINSATKAYVGPLAPGIFDKLREYRTEHVFTSFPEGKITRQAVEIGGKTAEQILQELEQENMIVLISTEYMMRSPDFTALPTTQMVDIVKLKVRDLEVGDYVTTDKLYQKAQELGLELCPPELGPRYRLQYKEQPLGERLRIGMKPQIGTHGIPSVFRLEHSADGLWLTDDLVEPPYSSWGPSDEIVFSIRKKA